MYTYNYIVIFMYMYPTSTEICRLKNSGRVPVDVRSPPLEVKIMLESNPLKSRLLLLLLLLLMIIVLLLIRIIVLIIHNVI